MLFDTTKIPIELKWLGHVANYSIIGRTEWEENGRTGNVMGAYQGKVDKDSKYLTDKLSIIINLSGLGLTYARSMIILVIFPNLLVVHWKGTGY